jgi:hypothetical protein
LSEQLKQGKNRQEISDDDLNRVADNVKQKYLVWCFFSVIFCVIHKYFSSVVVIVQKATQRLGQMLSVRMPVIWPFNEMCDADKRV